MSKLETPMILRYWKRVGGGLVEEFRVVDRKPGQSARWIDAIIVKGGTRRRIPISRAAQAIKGRDVIVVQAKAYRLGMNLMGQVVFSIELIKQFKPRSIEGIALVGENDSALGPLLEKRPGMKVVVDNRRS